MSDKLSCPICLESISSRVFRAHLAGSRTKEAACKAVQLIYPTGLSLDQIEQMLEDAREKVQNDMLLNLISKQKLKQSQPSRNNVTSTPRSQAVTDNSDEVTAMAKKSVTVYGRRGRSKLPVSTRTPRAAAAAAIAALQAFGQQQRLDDQDTASGSGSPSVSIAQISQSSSSSSSSPSPSPTDQLVIFFNCQQTLIESFQLNILNKVSYSPNSYTESIQR